MTSHLITLLLLPTFFFFSIAQQSTDYAEYHKSILDIEKSIVGENYKEALDGIATVSKSYQFVFLRDYKIATQLAVYLKDFESAFDYLKSAISAGWALKEVKKNKFLKQLTTMKEWSTVENEEETLRRDYHDRIDDALRAEAREMYKKDQKFASRYLFKIGQKAKENYGNSKGVPHVHQQLTKLNAILDTKGYPGEKLIGESQWMTIILAHHNSVSKDFVVNDSLYPSLRPKLLKAIARGELSPYDFAIIEDWKIAVTSERQETGYGYLDVLSKEEFSQSNALRYQLNIRTIDIRNGLVDIQEKTGMNFYLAGQPWVEGKIVPEN